MKRLLLIAASAVALTATSCHYDDSDSYYTDISIKDPVSLWLIYGNYRWGTEMGDNCVHEGADWRKPPIRALFLYDLERMAL